MNSLTAILLGIIQGLTEFLPISSSGHLVLGQHLLGIKEPELLFDVVLHLGTLVAVVLVFRQEIIGLLIELTYLPRVVFSGKKIRQAYAERPNFKMIILVLAGTVPTGLIGFLFKDGFERLFASTLAVGIALLFTGLILFLTKYAGRKGKPIERMSLGDAVIIGVAQGLAITPGVSRSGLTICTGLFRGLNRELAARYSFLVFIPAIVGALILEIGSMGAGTFGALDLSFGFLAAFLSGWGALVFLLKLVKKGKLHVFAYYCWLLGLVTIGVSLVNG